MSSFGDKSPSTGFHTPSATSVEAAQVAIPDEDIPPLPLSPGGPGSSGGESVTGKEESEESFGTLPMQSIEEFVNDNPVPESSAKQKSKKRHPTPGTVEPVVLSTSITTTHVKDLHELCQTHARLRPVFDIEQKLPQEFYVTLKLVGHGETKEIPVEGSYPSKKHAKEAAAKLGIDYVHALPKGESPGLFADASKETENWVGLLTGMCNGKQTRPQITDYATPHAGFSCEIRLPAELGIPGIEDQVFGDKHRSFKNKRSAKIAASKDAVLWIRERQNSLSTASIAGGRAQMTPAMGAGSIDILDNTPPAQVVNMICPRLGLASPEYVFTADPNAPGMYDVDAIIKRPKGSRPVKIGPVKSVYGKKRAKEDIAKSVLLWLSKEAKKQDIVINFVPAPPPPNLVQD